MDMANLALTGAMVATTAAPIGKKAYDKFLGKKPPTDSGGASGDNYRTMRKGAYQGNALDNIQDTGGKSSTKFGKFKKPTLKGVAQGAGIAGILGMGGEYAADYAKEKGYEKTGTALSVGSSALTGASIGMMLGPAGAAIGGVLGAAYGLYDEMSKDKKETEVKPEVKEDLNKEIKSTEISETSLNPVKDEIKNLGSKLDAGNTISNDIKTSINDLKSISKIKPEKSEIPEQNIAEPIDKIFEKTSKTMSKFFPGDTNSFGIAGMMTPAQMMSGLNPILGISSMFPKQEQEKDNSKELHKKETTVVSESKKDETNIKLLTDLNKNVKSLENIMADISRFTRENRDISEKLYRETT